MHLNYLSLDLLMMQIIESVFLGRDSIYIPIDKCASNSMRKVLTENGFISMQEIRDWDKALEKFKDWNHFAVVRQPVNRYISGLTEFIFQEFLIKTLMSMLKSH